MYIPPPILCINKPLVSAPKEVISSSLAGSLKSVRSKKSGIRSLPNNYSYNTDSTVELAGAASAVFPRKELSSFSANQYKKALLKGLENSWYRTINSRDYNVPIRFSRFATENQQLALRWLEALNATPGHHGLAIFGAAGSGKTTVVQEFLSAHRLHAFWLKSATQTDCPELLRSLAISKSKILVVDNCCPKILSNYQQLLSCLLEGKQLLNKNGDPIKVVLISNRKNPEFLLREAAIEMGLSIPDLACDYAKRFVSIELKTPDGSDFRTIGPKRGVICKSIENAGISELAYHLSMKRYLGKLDLLHDNCIAIKKTADGVPRGNLASQQYENATFHLKNFTDRTLWHVEHSPGVILDWDIDETRLDMHGHRCEPIIRQILDTMDFSRRETAWILSEDPQKTMEMLQKIMSRAQEPDRYLSRLQLFSIQPDEPGQQAASALTSRPETPA